MVLMYASSLPTDFSRLPLQLQHYRSYENWAQPIAGSDEILCRFETESRISHDTMRLDLELWLSRKKILKSGVLLAEGKPVLVLGPEWRGGRLIISVELVPDRAP